MSDLGNTALGAGLNAGFGILSGWLNNQWAKQREEEARQQNFELNEKAAENADARTRALYNDLYSPGAQLQQLKDAGLSPSLFYGDGGGISGQTGAQGAGAAGISPTTFGISPLDISQIKLNNAQAEKLTAEAETERGDNERGQAEIGLILQNTATSLADKGLKESAKALNEANERLTTIDADLKDATFEESARTIKYNSDTALYNSKKALYEAKNAKIDFTIKDETKDDQIKLIRDSVTKQLKEITKLVKGAELDEMQIKQLESWVAQKWDEIEIQKTNAFAYADYVENQGKYWKDYIEGYWKSLGIQEDRLKQQETAMWLGAAEAILQTGANTYGSYQMSRGYTTTSTSYNKHGNVTGKTVTHTTGRR